MSNLKRDIQEGLEQHFLSEGWSCEDNAELRALLDHVAYTLAEEYVQRMKHASSEPTD